jgi:UDP-N-acetylglucosamine 2-epimerase (non-hydrolysing)/GDP/UDP-N,N'-diacetylbacillosamine 2-epimerase (hydrolysing)
LHFVTNSDSGIRLGRMGEDDRYVFNVGSPGLDYLDHMYFMSKDEVEASLRFKLKRTNFLITFHAATLDSSDISIQLDGLMGVLAEFSNDVGLIFTLPNADTGGREIINKILAFSGERENATYHTSLGQDLYLSTLSHVDVVIGNSSSGLYEAPSIPVPTVNIGTRQKGRLKAESVFDCDSSESSIRNGIESALKFGKKKTNNPYKQGNSAEMIMQALDQTPDFKALIMKKFVG